MSFLNPGGGNATQSTTNQVDNHSQTHADTTNSNNSADDHSYNLGSGGAVDASSHSYADSHAYSTGGGALTVTDGGALAQVLDFGKALIGAGVGSPNVKDTSSHGYTDPTPAAGLSVRYVVIGGIAVVAVLGAVWFLKRRKG